MTELPQEPKREPKSRIRNSIREEFKRKPITTSAVALAALAAVASAWPYVSPVAVAISRVLAFCAIPGVIVYAAISLKPWRQPTVENHVAAVARSMRLAMTALFFGLALISAMEVRVTPAAASLGVSYSLEIVSEIFPDDDAGNDAADEGDDFSSPTTWKSVDRMRRDALLGTLLFYWYYLWAAVAVSILAVEASWVYVRVFGLTPGSS